MNLKSSFAAMAQVKITLTDMGNGQVSIQCKPPMPKLVEMARARDITQSQAFAIAALRQIITDSSRLAAEEKLAKDQSKIVTPNDPRFNMSNA